MFDSTITSLSEVASRGDAELVRDHCDPNCTHSLVTTRSFTKCSFELVVVIELACGFCDTQSAASRQIHIKSIFYFIFLFLLNNVPLSFASNKLK